MHKCVTYSADSGGAGRGMRWRVTPLMPNLAEFEQEDETEHDRNDWTPLNYFEQYIDQDLIKSRQIA